MVASCISHKPEFLEGYAMDQAEASLVKELIHQMPHVVTVKVDRGELDIDVKIHNWCMSQLGGDPRYFYQGTGWRMLVGRPMVENRIRTGRYNIYVCFEDEHYASLLALTL